MAAGAYKGLTIRIGADVTKLSNALRGADSAIHKTQTQLNNLNKASKLDPGNEKIAVAQLGALSAQATNAAREMALLQQGIDSLAKTKVVGGDGSIKNVDELAKSTESVTLAARDAERAYDDIDKRIEKLYRDIKRKNPDTPLADIRDITNSGKFDDSQLDDLVKTGRISQEQADSVRKLKDEWVAARNELDNYANAEKLEQMRNKAEALGVTMKNISAEMHQVQTAFNLSSTSQFDQGLGETNSKLALLESASQTAMQRFQALDQAVKLDPTNIDLSAKRAEALAEATDVASKHAEMLRDKISHYESQGMTAEAKGVKDVALNLEEAKQKYAEAEARVSDLVVEHAKLSEGAKVTADSMKEVGDSSEGLEQAARSADDVAKELEEAREAASNAFTEMETAKVISEHQALVDQLRQEDTILERLRGSFGNLRIQSNIAANFKDLNAQMKLVSTGADTAKNRFDQLKRASDIKPYSLSIAVEKVRALREATDAASQKAAILQQKLSAYKAAGVDKMSRQITDAAIAFEKANQRVKELQAEFKKVSKEEGETSAKARELANQLANATQYAKTVGAVNEYRNLKTEIRNVQATSKEMSNSMKADLGQVGTAAFMAAQQLAQMAQQAWSQISQSSNEVDSAYRDLRKTFNAEEDDYQRLYDAAMKYSQSHVTSADKMLEMEAIAAQLGVGLKGGADSVEKFADAAANLDVATDIDYQTVALQMGQIMNVMKDLDADNINNFGDALVRLGNNMPTQESNIMNIAQRMSAVANVTDMTTPQVLGWAAAIASTGVRSEQAATAISNTIMGIESAVAVGEEDLEAFAKIAGESADEFVRKWEKDPSDVLQKFIKGLGKLEDSDESAIKALEDLGIGGVRQKTTLLALTSTIDNLNDAIKMSEDAFHGVDDTWGDAGDAAREADRKAEGFSGSLQKLQNSIQVLSASFGPAFVDILDMVADKVQWLTTVVSGWSDEFKQKVIIAAGSFVAFSAIGTIIGPLAKSLFDFGKGAIGFVITQIAAMKDAFTGLSLGGGIVNLTSTGGKLGALVTKLTSLSTWATLAGGALATLGIVLAVKFAAKAVKAKLEADRFNKALDKSKDATKNLYGELMNGSDKISEFGRSWQDAKVDMNDFMTAMEEHNRIQAETRDEATESIGMLEKYKSVIDKAAGAGKNYDGSLAELKWAVEGLNEMLGTNYDYNEILKGSYNDAEGAAHSYREEIDKLIEAKEREIRLDAMSDLYAEEYKNLEKNKKALKDAREARRKFTQDYIKEHEGDTTRDTWTGEVRKKTHNELVSDAHATDTWQDLNNTVGEVTKETNASADALKYYDGALQSLLNEGRYAEEGFRGIREGIMLDSPTMMEAINNSSMFGDSIEEVGGKVKELAKKLMDAKVGTEEFAEMANEHPDVFADMVEQADGNMDKLVELISEWNMSELEDKYAGFTYDETGFVNAKGDRIDWNGTDWEFKAAEVKVDTKEVDEAEKKKEKLKGDVTFGIDVKDGGASKLIEDLGNTNLNAVTMKFEAEDDGVMSMYDMLQSLIGVTIMSHFKADTGDIEAASTKLNDLQGKDVDVNFDVSGIGDLENAKISLLDAFPTDVTTIFSAQTSGVDTATLKIGALNAVAGAMKDEYHTYQANGNAALSSAPSNMIRAVTSAAGSLTSKAVAYSASGNVITGNVADRIWDVVNAANRLVSKSVDLVTNIVTNTINNVVGGKSASGAYIPYNKMPRHAAGIFTRPTLTNIGWVGEDGAELYSGNSLVPLTNRKYSMPYIDDISSAVAKKLGAQSVGIDYELLGRSVATALAGMSVTIDGQALVGEIATQVERTSRFYAG